MPNVRQVAGEKTVGPDPRWNNPSAVPLTVGPVRTVTAPLSPPVALKQDGSLLEFLMPYPMHIVDPAPWPDLEVSIDGTSVRICRPFSTNALCEPAGRIGNETPEALSSIIHLTSPGHMSGQATVDKLWRVVHSLMLWIRVKARHFWVAHGLVGYGATFRGSLLGRAGNEVTQANYARYGPSLVVRPLDQGTWLSIQPQLQQGDLPPVSESVFCDALLSLVSGDEAKALLELGVACEIEITGLLEEGAAQSPSTPDKEKYKKKAKWERFAEKLDVWTKKLGLTDVSKFAPHGLPRDWAGDVRALYKLRNSVAHSGKTAVPQRDVVKHLFSANALFEYCRQERMRLGLKIYDYPPGMTPASQLLCYNDALLAVESGTSRGRIRAQTGSESA